MEPKYRKQLDTQIDALIDAIEKLKVEYPLTEGFHIRSACITYSFFKILKYFFGKNNWTYRSEPTKILMCCLNEFTRRFLNDYEDSKIQSNGDVT